MSRPFKIEIAESEEELKKRLQTARLGNQREKLQMLWWLKSGQVKEQQELGKRLGTEEIPQLWQDGYRNIDWVDFLGYWKLRKHQAQTEK